MKSLYSYRRLRRRHGLSTLEMLVSFTILVLLGIAFMTLYVNVLRNSTRVTAVTYTSWDAANAVDQINLALREARRFEFMDNGTTGPSTYQTPSSAGSNPNYLSTQSDGTSIVTGLHIVFPAALNSVNVNVPSSTGITTTPMSGADGLVDYRTDGTTLDIYRSDAAGHPAPSTGTYLWLRGTLNGVAIANDSNADTAKGITGRPLIDDLSSWAGAVQFIQGQANELQIKVVTGGYDPVNKKLSSESTKGAVTALSAEHVYLRNHDPNGVTAGSAHGKTQYSGT